VGVGDGTGSSSRNNIPTETARSILHDCSRTLEVLAGSSTSIGTISDIAKNVKTYGLPGLCCREFACKSMHCLIYHFGSHTHSVT